jgi:rSAM/selenodomain-associated transferase 2
MSEEPWQPPTIAVIIPTLNEAASLAEALGSVAAQRPPGAHLIVADGGSTDRTCEIAAQHGAHVVHAKRCGRGCQIAEAISQIDEDVVLILHADMVLSADALARLRLWLVDHPNCVGGCLGHRFASTRWRYRLMEWWDCRRARRGIAYGDQAQFFRREWLKRHGGFPDQPIMEDLELSRRLLRSGQPAYLDCPVVVSPRRFERLGWWRTSWANLRLRRSYRARGLPACQELYRRYYEGS